jgi:hypothetical protein
MTWLMKRIWILMTGLMVVGIGGCGGVDKEETITGPEDQEIAEAAPVGSVSQSSESSDPVPDIALEDVNSFSPLFGTKISPRNFLDEVSAWYFGYST